MKFTPLSFLLATWLMTLVVGCGPGTPRGSIHSAVERGDLKTVQQHIAYGTDVNARNSDGWTPLLLAAKKGDLPIVQELLKAGADVKREGPLGETAVTLAQRGGHNNVVQALQPQAAGGGQGEGGGGGRQLIDGGTGVSEVLDAF
jgi:ankyrin repeat protein